MTSPAAADEASGPSVGFCDLDCAIGNRELIDEERLQHGHSFSALRALPERSHIRLALPLRDSVARIRIVLVLEKPLPFQPLHFAANFQSSFEGSLESIPLAGHDFAPDDPHMHCDSPYRRVASRSEALLWNAATVA